MARVKGGKAYIDFYGTSELLKKLEKAGANLEKEIVNAIDKSVQKPKKEMLDFAKKHKQTGDTERSWTEKLTSKNGVVEFAMGFSVRKGGLPAIFLNLGGMYTEPTFFIDKAVEENVDEIKRIQIEALEKAFKELL